MTAFTLRPDKESASPATVVFDIGFRSAVTNAHSSRLEEVVLAIQPSLGADELNRGVVRMFGWILATTRTIDFLEFDDNTSDHLLGLRTFWRWFWDAVAVKQPSLFHSDGRLINSGLVADPAILAEAWIKFNVLVSDRMQEIWSTWFLAAQNVHTASPLDLPEAMLTNQQKGDPDFLAPGKPTAKTGGGGRVRGQKKAARQTQ